MDSFDAFIYFKLWFLYQIIDIVKAQVSNIRIGLLLNENRSPTNYHKSLVVSLFWLSELAVAIIIMTLTITLSDPNSMKLKVT